MWIIVVAVIAFFGMYALKQLSQEKEIDIVDGLKWAIFGGISGWGGQWALDGLNTSIPVEKVIATVGEAADEMFTGVPQF